MTTLHVLAHQIRYKLEIDPLRPQHLANVRSVGYVWYADPPSLNDGIDYERRVSQYQILRHEMQALIGGDPDAPIHPEIARQLDDEIVPRAGALVEASYTAVDTTEGDADDR
jgi:hypothetical protein